MSAVARPRVLIVDDSAALARAVHRGLRDRFDCEVATNDVDALAALSNGVWDAIVCDVLMPDFSGPQIYRWVRDTRPHMLNKMVFVTGLDAHAAQRALEGVTAPVLLKPFTVEQLRAAIEQVLANAAS